MNRMAKVRAVLDWQVRLRFVAVDAGVAESVDAADLKSVS